MLNNDIKHEKREDLVDVLSEFFDNFEISEETISHQREIFQVDLLTEQLDEMRLCVCDEDHWLPCTFVQLGSLASLYEVDSDRLSTLPSSDGETHAQSNQTAPTVSSSTEELLK